MITPNDQEFTVADNKVTVHELTVEEIREWLKEVDQQIAADEYDFLGDQLFEDCSFEDLTRMSTITIEQLNKMRPSEIRFLADECQNKNPHFFRVVGKHRALVSRHLGQL